jgi:alkylation response protein AidB-like acyl-CoA dehydrogenase
MKASFEQTDDQQELVRSLEASIERHAWSGPVDADAWRMIGDLGVLALGTEAGGGTTADLLAAAHCLGWACVQGPLIGAVLGTRVLGSRSDAVGAGQTSVGIASDGIIAWSTADVILDVDGAASGDGAWWVARADDARPFDTMADEPWARATVTRLDRIEVLPRHVAAAELARSAWLVGAGRRVIDLAAAHARDRQQFGQPIGNFQGVAHPLAMSTAELGAAIDLARLAAIHLDADDPDAARLAAAARLTATDAALTAAYASHQVHGAVGFSAERGLDRWSAAIRQMSHHPPASSTALLATASAHTPGSSRQGANHR